MFPMLPPNRGKWYAGPIGEFFNHLLTFHVDERFKHFITNGDYFRIGLEATLSYNHVGKFVCDINIGHLKR